MKKYFFAVYMLAFTCIGSLFADVYVDNVRGSDRNSGTEDYPVKTISAGIQKMKPGTTLHLKPNVKPYRESVRITGAQETLVGFAKTRTVIDGHGAVIDGMDELPASSWTGRGNGIFTTHLANTAACFVRQDFWSGFPIVYANNVPLDVRKSPGDLTDGSYCLVRNQTQKNDSKMSDCILYVKLSRGKTPSNVRITVPDRLHGIEFYGCTNITVKNITFAHCLDSGIQTVNAKDGILIFEHIRCTQNMGPGMSNYGSALVIVRDSRFDGNAGGCTLDANNGKDPAVFSSRTQVHYVNCLFEQDLFRCGLISHGADVLLESCIIRNNPNAAIDVSGQASVTAQNCAFIRGSHPLKCMRFANVRRDTELKITRSLLYGFSDGISPATDPSGQNWVFCCDCSLDAVLQDGRICSHLSEILNASKLNGKNENVTGPPEEIIRKAFSR